MSEPTQIIDPDLVQAMEDLRPVAAALREARGARRSLPHDAPLNARFAADSKIADLRSRITARADRIAIPADALLIIFAEEAKLQQRQRRRPARRLMIQALAALRGHATEQLAQARDNLAQAQYELAAAERYERAAAGAHTAFAGVA